jgi:hypothetical protein
MCPKRVRGQIAPGETRVRADDIRLVIIAMTIFPRKRQAHRVMQALRACGLQNDVAVAAVARLSAADKLDGRELFERHGEKLLLEAISSAKLYQVDGHFYFDPDEFVAAIRDMKAQGAKAVVQEEQAALPASAARCA